MSAWPPLEPLVRVDSGLGPAEVDALWDRFEVFEALHHSQSIANPMTSAHLDALVDAVRPQPGDRVVEFGCGSAELLVRLGERARISGLGIDASPWMLNAAARRIRTRLGPSAIDLRLAELTHEPPEPGQPLADVVVCVGAEWIWHGVAGTVKALASRCGPTGRIVIGVPRLHHDAARQQRRIETCAEVEAMLAACGLRPAIRVDPTDADWDAYLADTAADAAEWAARNPGPRAERWLDEQRDWARARDRDRQVTGWSAWVATPGG